MEDLTAVVEHALARSLWVQAWADDEGERDRHHKDPFAAAPPEPSSAHKLARAVLKDTVTLNGTSIRWLMDRAHRADGTNWRDVEPDEFAREFGRDLGLMVTESGASWFDNHRTFDLKFPILSVMAGKKSGKWTFITPDYYLERGVMKRLRSPDSLPGS